MFIAHLLGFIGDEILIIYTSNVVVNIMVVYCHYNYDHYATMMNLIMLITFIIIVAIVIITISISNDNFAKQARKCWMAEGQRKGQESRFAK